MTESSSPRSFMVIDDKRREEHWIKTLGRKEEKIE